VEVVYRKTIAFRDSLANCPGQLTPSDTLAVFAIGLALPSSLQIKILDFGGACGAHYFRLRALLHEDIPLRYHVVETSAMAKKARPLQTDELSFFDSLHEAQNAMGHIDILYSSGTLQCVPDPHLALKQLLDCGASYLVLPRLGLSETSADVITVEDSRLSANGPGPMPADIPDGISRYPFTFPARKAIEAAIMNVYKIILRVADDSGVFPVNDEPLSGLGYVAQKKTP
jgi:putative methyltransferase (TIGR04325 family)